MLPPRLMLSANMPRCLPNSSSALFAAAGLKLKDSAGLDDAASRCIAEVSETKSEKGGTVKFKLHDKRGALTDLMRHLGLFNDNLNLGGSIGLRWEDALKELE